MRDDLPAGAGVGEERGEAGVEEEAVEEGVEEEGDEEGEGTKKKKTRWTRSFH
jgi:hypothetical protein